MPAIFMFATSCASARAADHASEAASAAGQTTVVAAAAGTVPAAAAPAPDTARINALARRTAPNDPLQLTFTWALQDRDFKFQGRGVVRMQGPYRARLDLFGVQDIQVVRATLIDDSLEIVYAGPKVPLPPIAFLWAVVGVFRPPVPQEPTALTGDASSFAFSYDPAPAHWRFKADSTTLRSAEWQGDDGGRRTVELSGPFRFNRPSKAVYRDWREFRELTLTVTAVEKVDPFAPEIWNVSNQ